MIFNAFSIYFPQDRIPRDIPSSWNLCRKSIPESPRYSAILDVSTESDPSALGAGTIFGASSDRSNADHGVYQQKWGENMWEN